MFVLSVHNNTLIYISLNMTRFADTFVKHFMGYVCVTAMVAMICLSSASAIILILIVTLWALW